MDEVRIYMSHSLRYFLLISIPAVFGLSALAKPLLGILTTEDFLSGWVVIPIIAFSGLLAGVFQIFVNTMLLVKQTKTATYINIVAAVSNVLINILLIPSVGIVGASLSTLFSYFLMAVLCMHVSLKQFKLDFYFHDIAKSILSSIAMYLFVFHFVISSIFELFEIAGMGVLIYLVVMFLLGGFSDHELSLIRRYLLRVKSEVKQ
jgi:O-antigen/teichoic acid export membrane protein